MNAKLLFKHQNLSNSRTIKLSEFLGSIETKHAQWVGNALNGITGSGFSESKESRSFGSLIPPENSIEDHAKWYRDCLRELLIWRRTRFGVINLSGVFENCEIK
jgi:hypothetical protein